MVTPAKKNSLARIRLWVTVKEGKREESVLERERGEGDQITEIR